MTTPEEIINSKPDSAWTLVTRRRRGKTIPDPASRCKARCSSSRAAAASPWTPVETYADPDRVSKLLRRMQSSIDRLNNSRYFRCILSRLRHPVIQGGLAKLLTAGSRIQFVAYGIGSIESYEVPRLQLALAILLRQELGVGAAGPIEVFDPILSAVECNVVTALGCTVIYVDERGRREATKQTLFYMPHCEAALYDNLLAANWNPAMLNRMVVLGNSFGMYDAYVNERRGSGSVSLEIEGRHVLGIRRYVKEVEMEDGENFSGSKRDDQEVEFYEAFHDLSWHFFELDDNADMDFLVN